MNLDRYEKLKERLETASFDTNFGTINKILFYFSYLGNIFLVLFSYFFLKTVTDTIPTLFPGQDMFFSIFIVLFMTGYELFKRFAIEQLFQNWFVKRKISAGFVGGVLVCLSLTAGSFYLSIKGSHRLVDSTKSFSTQNDSIIKNKTQELQKAYEFNSLGLQKQIDNTSNLINKTVDAGTAQGRPLTKLEQRNVSTWGETISKLKEEKIVLDSTYQANKEKLEKGDFITETDVSTNKENNLAFYILTLFLELLILAGVGFSGYFNVESFSEMKSLMRTERYQKMQNNISMLKIYYHNGSKKDGDPCPSNTKFASLVKLQGLDVKVQDIQRFTHLLSELQITHAKNKKNRVFAVSYEKALDLIKK